MKTINSLWVILFFLGINNTSLATSVVFSEDFNNPNSLDGWTIKSSGKASQTWNIQEDHYRVNLDNSPILTSWDYSGEALIYEVIESPVIPLSSESAAYLSLDVYISKSTTSFIGYVEVFNGTTWQNVHTYDYDQNPQTDKFDVTAYANDNFKFRFVYENIDGNNWESFFMIDNVVVEGDVATSSESISKNSFNFYPNPAYNVIQLDGVTPNTLVTIFDVSGKVVSESNLSNNTVDVSNLLNGVYFIKVGEETKKFIKK